MNRPPQRSTRTGKRFAGCLAVALAVFAGPGGAATCNVSTTGVSFGGYNPFATAANDSAGTITVRCDVAAPYTIALSPGGATYATRAMTASGHALNYNLYNDSTRTSVWGDGTSGTVTVPGNGTTVNHTVYGRIPARQNAYLGSYTDSIVVTLTF